MTTNCTLILIHKKHQTWIDIVKSFGCTQETSEDIVQEMYIKIHKYLEKGGSSIMYNDEINYYFIFKTLNSIFIDIKRKGKGIVIVPIDDLQIENLDINYIRSFDKVQGKLKTMFWYYRRIFEIINSGESVAEFSRKSNIPYFTAYNTYIRIKKELKKLI